MHIHMKKTLMRTYFRTHLTKIELINEDEVYNTTQNAYKA